MTLRSILLFILLWMSVGLNGAAQQITLEGLRSVHGQGEFHGLRSDSGGNLYTLFDAHDGIHLLKLDPTGTNLIGSADLGSAGDSGIALDLDYSGSVYITGTSTSQGTLTGTSGTAFPGRADSTTNSFVARFNPSLNLQWLTFCGSGRMAATGIAASTEAVLITGSIFSPTLPVTNAGIQQSPAPGSSANGFVERFTATGTLNYATYLTGANGDTAPSGITVAPDGSAYVIGTTTASGFPTTNALVPVLLAADSNSVSGFLTHLTPAGDGFLFSTFVPGDGLSSVALDMATSTVLVSGSIAPGLFPITHVQRPFTPALPYQSLARIALDGSAVVEATLLSPGTQSAVAAASGGIAWVAVSSPDQTFPTLPAAISIPDVGDAIVYRLNSAGAVDRAFRLGGRTANNGDFAGMPTTFSGLAATATSASVAGSIAPTLSSNLLNTERYDLPFVRAPNAALPSTVRDALPSASCAGSLCSGSAALLAQVNATATTPVLALAFDDLPNLTLRNAGDTTADNLGISANGFTLENGCGTQLLAGAECDLVLSGSGPGSISVSAVGWPTRTIALPSSSDSTTAAEVSVTPGELNFGINTAFSALATRTLTLTNLSAQLQTISSYLVGNASRPYTLAESSSDCTAAGGGSSKALAPGAVCHITLALTAAKDPSGDGPVLAHWMVGTRQIQISGYSEAAAVVLSANRIDFGRQYTGGLQIPRFLFLSNNSDTAQPHIPVTVPPSTSFSLIDGCSSTLEPMSVCRMDIGYVAASTPSTDTLTLDIDGIPVLLHGETLSPPSATASSANPNLQVSPTIVTFANAVPVTSVSSETQTAVVHNMGSTPIALTLALTGDFLDSTDCPALLTGGASCSVVLSFAPSSSGTRSGLLAVSDGDSAPTYEALSGTATAILPSNSEVIDFGPIPVGTPFVQWIKVSQPFSNFVLTSSAPAFGVVLVEDIGYGHGDPSALVFGSTASGTCFNCYIGIQFTPVMAGSAAGSLKISSGSGGNTETVALTGIGVAVNGLTLSPGRADFGSVSVGSSTAATLFTLTNATATDLSISAIAVTGDFQLAGQSTIGPTCSVTLVRNASCLLGVQFQPTAEGVRSGSLNISTSSGSIAAQLGGFGTADTGITFNPGELRFLNQPGTSATQQQILITNSSTAPEMIGAVSVSEPHFTVVSDCRSLAPAATCTFIVSYSPTDSEAFGFLTIPVTSGSGDATTSASYTVALNGLYTLENAGLQIEPGGYSDVQYGAAATGSIAGTRLLHVTNLTAHSLTMGIDAPRQFPVVSTDCGTLAPFAGCDMAVSYVPILSGDATGTVSVQGTPDDGSATLSGLGYVQGYGSGEGTLDVTGPLPPVGPLDFGEVASGQAAARTLTLTNRASSGSAVPVTVRRVRSEFPFHSTSDCGQPLDAGQSCHINITYAPIEQITASAGEPGTQADSGVLTIEADAANAPLFLDLAGRSTPVVVTSVGSVPFASIVTSAGALFFSVTVAGTVSPPQTFYVSNTGTAVVHITGIIAPLGFTANSACADLIAGASCAVTVAFTPQTAGGAVGSLEIQSDSNTSLEYVSLLASADVASVSLQPNSINFGTALIGSSQSASAVLSNNAATPVVLEQIATTGDFSAISGKATANACPATGSSLPSGATCSIALAFKPARTGSRKGTLTVATSATALPLSITLTGTGLQPQLTATPAALSFGNLALGASASLSLTLANTSFTPVTGLTLTAANTDYRVSSGCGITALAAGSSCSVTITFQPSATGLSAGVLSIVSSDPASPLQVSLTGTGIGLAKAIDPGSFLLTVNNGSSASSGTRSGTPTSFSLALTPIGGFTGDVALTCTPALPASYVLCSLLPSSVTLKEGTVASLAVVNTISAVAAVPPHLRSAREMLACFVLPCGLLLVLRRRPKIGLLTIAITCIIFSNGCGGDSRVRYAAPGVYRFTITASATGGTPIAQSVTIDVTVSEH